MTLPSLFFFFLFDLSTFDSTLLSPRLAPFATTIEHCRNIVRQIVADNYIFALYRLRVGMFAIYVGYLCYIQCIFYALVNFHERD